MRSKRWKHLSWKEWKMELSILWKAIPETAAGRTIIPLGTMKSWDMEFLRIKHLTLILAFSGWYQGRFFYLKYIGVGYKLQLAVKNDKTIEKSTTLWYYVYWVFGVALFGGGIVHCI